MVAHSEMLSPQVERRPPPPQERDPLQHNREIEEQQSLFWAALEDFQSHLKIGEDPKVTIQRLQQEVLEQKHGSSELQQATAFFALVTAAEVFRNPHHAPNWPQSEAALHMIFPYADQKVQRIQMAPGEGKTFTIAMASLWEASHGKSVTIHTDKHLNVQQSHDKMAGLYDLFAVTHDEVHGMHDLGNDYGKYLNGLEPYSALPLIRYGTWSQCMHEYLLRQQIMFQCEATLRGDLGVMRKGAKLTEAGQKQFEASLAYQKNHLIPDFIPVDEGDLSMDREDSPVVISATEAELSQREQSELGLAWKMFQEQQPARNGQKGTIDRLAAALDYDVDKTRARFEVVPKVVVEGMQSDSDRSTITAQGVDVNMETFYEAKLYEAAITPSLLVEMLKLMQLQYQDGELPNLPLPLKNIERIQELATTAIDARQEDLDWSEIEEALPSLTRAELRDFFGKANQVFNYQNVLDQQPKLRALLSRDNDELLPVDTEMLEDILGADVEQLMQRVTIHRLVAAIAPVWEPMMTQYSHDVFNVMYMMHEGDNYQIAQTGDDSAGLLQATVLGPDRQPQPGKQFQGTTQAFVHLKHGLELPNLDKTIAQIMPITWYQMMARRRAKVASISGTQDEPDFEVESTGTSQVEILPTLLFEVQAQKLRAIVEYVTKHNDVPILLCVPDVDELMQLEVMLRKLPGRGLEVLDAKHADEAGRLVPFLEKGKILLLQFSARGLDFGRILDDGQGHSFEDGLILSADQLPDDHQQKQLEGRVGGKRPKGRVRFFTSFDGKLAQKFYEVSPETAQKRHDKIAILERGYVEIMAQHKNTRWPASIGEAVAQIETWDEIHAPTDRGQPFWMRIANESRDFQRLAKTFESLRERHLRDLKKQQQWNLTEINNQRRRQMAIDVVVQNLWLTVMNPTEETPLGKVLLPLTHEQRQVIIERVFEEAPQLYPLSAAQTSSDSLASADQNEKRKMAQFMKDMVDRITMWIDLEKLDRRYMKLKLEGTLFADQIIIPENFTKLEEWLKAQRALDPKEPAYRKPLQAIAKSLMLGLRMYGQPENTEPLPEPKVTDQDKIHQLRAEFFRNLREVAQKESQIRRKFQAEK